MNAANRSLTIDILGARSAHNSCENFRCCTSARLISYLAQAIVERDQIGTEDDLDLADPFLCFQQSHGHGHDVCEIFGDFPLVGIVKYVAAPVIEIAGIGERR